ncbi:MAG: hypothetical protein QM784_07185 [Polyangiaceae bacterium]
MADVIGTCRGVHRLQLATGTEHSSASAIWTSGRATGTMGSMWGWQCLPLSTSPIPPTLRPKDEISSFYLASTLLELAVRRARWARNAKK